MSLRQTNLEKPIVDEALRRIDYLKIANSEE